MKMGCHPPSNAKSPALMNTSLTRLQSFYSEIKTPLLLHTMIKREFPGSIAVLTSFGAEAGLLLSMVAEVDPATPVLFLNTGKHFAQTLDYSRTLSNHLGLSNVRTVAPAPALLADRDVKGELWQSDPVRCCTLRKSEPLARALEDMGYLALITGRSPAPRTIELDENGVFRINPLAGWKKEAQNDEMIKRSLPSHPLAAAGYVAIGCEACTLKAHVGQGTADRWAFAAGFEDGPQSGDYSAATPATDWSV